MGIKNSCKAPISGETIDLSEVNDPVFSNKILGDGVAIRPNDKINISHRSCICGRNRKWR